MSDWVIRSISTDDSLEGSARVVRESFRDVADEFGLNEQNCPTSPAFETAAKLRAARKKGKRYFGMFEGTEQTGFVAIEKAGPDLYYLERLGVLPRFRHRGRAGELVAFVLGYVRDRGGGTVSIGTIAGNARLIEWYRGLGFIERETRGVEGLPFEVTFLEVAVD